MWIAHQFREMLLNSVKKEKKKAKEKKGEKKRKKIIIFFRRSMETIISNARSPTQRVDL